jgi:hypothetical protein
MRSLPRLLHLHQVLGQRLPAAVPPLVLLLEVQLPAVPALVLVLEAQLVTLRLLRLAVA